MPKHVLILGGGFAGVAVAQELTHRLRRRHQLVEPNGSGASGDSAVAVRLVDRNNYSVFQPFLPEILSATIEPTHAVVPLRRLLPHVSVDVGIVDRIDTSERCVHFRRPLDGEPFEISYDVLVIALGGVTNLRTVPGMAEHALPMRSLGDAFYLRNRVLDMLEAAAVEPDPNEREELLSFVVVGGGSTGVEVAAQLHDLVHAAAKTFQPDLHPQVHLVHGHNLVIEEYGQRLARYTTRLLKRMGVALVLGRHVRSIDEHGVDVDDGQRIKARTVVTTVGNAPNPILTELPTDHDRRGWVRVEPTFEVPGLPGVWALGDAVTIPDVKTGKPMPATAQHAIREGPHVAQNILAVLDGRKPTPFHYDQLGMLVSLGRRKAAGVVLGVKVSGFVAWFAWRGYYLLRLPTLDRRVRVALDWAADLVLPRDVVEMQVRRTVPRAEGAADGASHAEERNSVVV